MPSAEGDEYDFLIHELTNFTNYANHDLVNVAIRKIRQFVDQKQIVEYFKLYVG